MKVSLILREQRPKRSGGVSHEVFQGKRFQAEETSSAKMLSLPGGFEEYLEASDWKEVNETDSSKRLKDF